MFIDELIAYYTTDCIEQYRLERDKMHSIEYITTMHFLLKHLPKDCSVLDCCAGGGIYAFPLAEQGYKVTAGDLIQEHVDIINNHAKRPLLSDVYQGNVLNLPYEDESFDAVLCLGALYHLMNESDRIKCVEECLRVLKPNGIFIFAYINRNAVFINHFNRTDEIDYMRNVLKTGENGLFYGMDFTEPNRLMAKFNAKKITDIGVDGLVYPLYNRLNECSEDEFKFYMEYHLDTCEQPSIIGHSMHGLWIGRKI